jgi:hypothetical protein
VHTPFFPLRGVGVIWTTYGAFKFRWPQRDEDGRAMLRVIQLSRSGRWGHVPVVYYQEVPKSLRKVILRHPFPQKARSGHSGCGLEDLQPRVTKEEANSREPFGC